MKINAAMILMFLYLLFPDPVKAVDGAVTALDELNPFSIAVTHLYDRISDEAKVQEYWRKILVQLALSGFLEEVEQLDCLLADGDVPWVIRAKADHYSEKGSGKEAVKILDRLSEQYQLDDIFLMYLADSYQKAGDIKKMALILQRLESKALQCEDEGMKYASLVNIMEIWRKSGNQKKVGELLQKEYVDAIADRDFSESYSIVRSLDDVFCHLGTSRKKALKPLMKKINTAGTAEEKYVASLSYISLLALFGDPENALKKLRVTHEKIQKDPMVNHSWLVKGRLSTCAENLGIALGTSGNIEEMKKVYDEFIEEGDKYLIPMDLFITAKHLNFQDRPEKIIDMLAAFKMSDKTGHAKCLLEAVDAFIRKGVGKKVYSCHISQIVRLLAESSQDLILVEELLSLGTLCQKAGIVLSDEEKKALKSIISPLYSFENMRERIRSEKKEGVARKARIRDSRCRRYMTELEDVLVSYVDEAKHRRQQNKTMADLASHSENQWQTIGAGLDQDDPKVKLLLEEKKKIQEEADSRIKPVLPELKDQTLLKGYPFKEAGLDIDHQSICPSGGPSDYIIRIKTEGFINKIWIECPRHGTKENFKPE